MANFQLTQYDVEQFLLILVRIASFLYTAPIFSLNRSMPNRTKLGFAAIISLLIFPMVNVEPVQYQSMIQFMAIIIKETTIGLVIGFMANICINILNFAGQIIDMEIGFSMVSLFDPSTNQQSTITGTMYTYFIMLLLIVSDMYQYIVRAIIDSYKLIPINGMELHISKLADLFLQYASDCFIIGFRIILPFFTVTLILNVILGILAKIAPQMNMFVIGMQLKVFAGLLVFVITAMLLTSVANFIFSEMKTLIVAAINAMT